MALAVCGFQLELTRLFTPVCVIIVA